MNKRSAYAEMLANGYDYKPLKGVQRNYLTVCANEELSEAIKRMAKKRGMAISDFVKEAIFQKYPRLKELNK